MQSEKLQKQQTREFVSGEIDFETFKKHEGSVNDGAYFDFIKKSKNGGFFYGKSLHLYSYSNSHGYHNIESVNQALSEQFKGIVSGLFSFGQDVFGHQFAFDLNEGKIIFFNIETGEKEIIANDFSDWVGLILEQTDYFTGKNIAKDWEEKNSLNFDQRLCPKIPFVLKGDYVLDNLYASNYPDFLISNANIANQIYGLRDGTQYKIAIKHNK